MTTTSKISLQPIAKMGWQATALNKRITRLAAKRLFIGSLQHRHLDAVTFRRCDGDLIPRVGVSDHAHAWIGGQDAFQPASRFGSPIRHDDLSRVL